MTIDLSASNAKAACEALPDAVLVADRFHLIALANDMLTQVRQRVIREAMVGAAARPTQPGPHAAGCRPETKRPGPDSRPVGRRRS